MKYLFRVCSLEEYSEDGYFFPVVFFKSNMDNSLENTFDESKNPKHYFLNVEDAYVYNYLGLNETYITNRINIFAMPDNMINNNKGYTKYKDENNITEVEEVAIPRDELLRYLGVKDDGSIVMVKKENLERFYVGYIDLDKNEVKYFNKYLKDYNEDNEVEAFLDSQREYVKSLNLKI